MKRYTYIIIAFNILLFAFICNNVKAQKELCGNDTIILNLTNFHYGSIQWEESSDSITWVAIPNAVDTFYKFYSEKSKYYRAVGITAECPPNYSEVTFVVKPVKANAGIDRILTGNKVSLSANSFKGTTGKWTVLNGSGSTINNDIAPYTELSGLNGNTYQLLWTLTNACGTYYDTVNVEFKQNIYRNTYVIVDSTDNILSDSSQRANGTYNIIFTSPVPTITDSTVLIGIIGEGFMQKVVSFQKISDTFFIKTKQAYITDFISDGAINFASNIYPNTTLTRSGDINGKSTGKYPTRKELLNNIYKDGYIFYEGTRINKLEKGVFIHNNSRGTDGPEINISFSDFPLYEDGPNGVSITLATGAINIKPNIVSEFEVKWFNLKKFNIGLNNAKFEYTIGPDINCTKSFSLLNYKKTLLSYTKIYLFSAGGPPILVTADIDLIATLNMEAKGNVKASAQVTKTDIVSAGIRYNPDNRSFEKYFEKSENIEFNNNFDIKANIEQSFSIGPEIKLKLYALVGGYINIDVLKESLNLCMNPQGNWSGGCDLSSEITVGALAELEITPKIKAEFRTSQNFSYGWYKLKFPYELNIISGDQQNGIANQNLPKPIIVQVKSDKGFNVPLVPVRFETLDGTLSDTVVYTNIAGLAQVNWEITNKTGAQQLKVYVLDCNNNYINNTPKTIYASIKDDIDYDCSKSSLSLKLFKNSNEIYPAGVNGIPPYQYSRDGIIYSGSVKDVLVNNHTYSYYVKDSKGCIKSGSCTYVVDTCQSSNLSLSLRSDSNTIIAQATGGKPPYKYALDNSTTFSSNNFFSNASYSKHNVFVIDMQGCKDSSDITIFIKNITLTDIDGNVYNTVTIGNQTWMKENLKVSHSRNGDPIPNITDSVTWRNLSTGAFCDYNNTPSNSITYGKLYNWFAVSDSRNLCPTGWHVPTDNDWTTLTDYLTNNGYGYQGSGNDIAKSLAVISGWGINSTPGTVGNDQSSNNSTGYTALPGGYRASGKFNSIGNYGSWWSFTEYGTFYAYYRGMGYGNSNVLRNYSTKPSGFSVRCLRDNYTILSLSTTSISAITDTTASSGGNITSDGGSAIISRGVCWSTNQNPTLSNNISSNGTGTGNYTSNLTGLTSNTTYYIRAYATNSASISYGNQVSFTTSGSSSKVTDIDGNVYDTVRIGSQSWLKQNLKVTHYRNGDPIPNITVNTAWVSLTTGAYCNYNNDTANATTYGRLYNWYTVNDSRGICPTGWHVPTDAEWTTLDNYLMANGYNYDGTTTGNKYAKSLASDNGWVTDAGTGTVGNTDYPAKRNVTGFTALPGGYRDSTGAFLGIGGYGNWWSSSVGSVPNTWFRGVDYVGSSFYRSALGKVSGFSVRCVKDN